jgi:hypothetical protein
VLDNQKKALASVLTEAFREKVAGPRGTRPLYEYVADHLWQLVLQGKPHTYRNWLRFREFARTFDDSPPRVIHFLGGLSGRSPEATIAARRRADGF